MVAIVKTLKSAPQRQPKIEKPSGALSKLKTLHAEAEETARLANLLGRSAYAGIVLPVLAMVTMGLSVDVNPAAQLVWLLFVGGVALATLLAYRHAIKRPFDRPALKDYAKDLSAILLFSGFAWGAGAFLALPASASAVGVVLFAMLPAAAVAYMLRDRDALLLFLAPVSALAIAACLLKPVAGGVWTAIAVLLIAATVAAAARWYEKLTGISSRPAMLSLP